MVSGMSIYWYHQMKFVKGAEPHFRLPNEEEFVSVKHNAIFRLPECSYYKRTSIS